MAAAFDRTGFVQECIAALAEEDPIEAIRAAVERAVADPAALRLDCPVPLDPDDDGLIHRADDLFVTQAVFPRGYRTGIHDHRVAAVIGVWHGHEDNVLYRRDGDRVLPAGTRRVATGEVIVLDADTAHDVHAPSDTWSGALHVYLGDITSFDRSAWSDAAGIAAAHDGAESERRWHEAAVATGLISSSGGGRRSDSPPAPATTPR